jgi:ribose/xylose/arabinose/galactoside ABC-type transport system permease subunit
MSNQNIVHQGAATPPASRRLPVEVNILAVLIGIALLFEALGWLVVGQSFLMNPQRLTIMILQVSVTGIIAIGVTQVIITGGIDLSSGSVVGMTLWVSFAQSADAGYSSIAHQMPAIVRSASDWPSALCPAQSTVVDRLFADPLHRHAGHDGLGSGHRALVH